MMENIIIIANDPAGIHTGNLHFVPTGNNFVLTVPDSIREVAEKQKIKAPFFSDCVPSFYGHESLSDLERSCGIENLEGLLTQEIKNTAYHFMDLIKDAQKHNHPIPFNGSKLGVSGIHVTRDPETEESIIDIHTHSTNYFTHNVTLRVFKILRDQGHVLFQDEALKCYPKPKGIDLGFLMNAFGVNASVTCENQYIFGTRPDGALHVAMSEGLHPSHENVEGPMSLTDLFNRGMYEELGIRPGRDVYKETPKLRELFITKSGMIQCHVMAPLKISLSELKASHERAKDRYENPQFLPVPFKREVLSEMANDTSLRMVPFGRDLIHGLAFDML